MRSVDDVGGRARILNGVAVGFSQIGAESAWRTGGDQSIQDEAKKRGVDLKFADAQQKQENQIKAVRSFIAQKVDAIILAPVVETGWEPVLARREAREDPGHPRRPRHQREGRVALHDADRLRLRRRGAHGRRVAGEEDRAARRTSPSSRARPAPRRDRPQEGLRGGDRRAPGDEDHQEQTGDFTRAGGKEVMEAFLKSPEGKEINAVYAHNDDMALGAIQAIEEAGKKPGTDIIVVSIDGVKRRVRGDGRTGSSTAPSSATRCSAPPRSTRSKRRWPGKELPKKTIVEDKLFEQSQAKERSADAEVLNRSMARLGHVPERHGRDASCCFDAHTCRS